MSVSVKRVYEPARKGDGRRVLVDRLWPRGLTKEGAGIDEWLRDLAPSNELRKWYHSQPERWDEFRKRYLTELYSERARVALDHLYQLQERGKLTLLFAAKNENRNNAIVLRDLLEGARKPPTGTGPAAAGAVRARRAARAPRR
jgi:uncharacterized protein YeaO (DUF488 family)